MGPKKVTWGKMQIWLIKKNIHMKFCKVHNICLKNNLYIDFKIKARITSWEMDFGILYNILGVVPSLKS